MGYDTIPALISATIMAANMQPIDIKSIDNKLNHAEGIKNWKFETYSR